jgi:hypothetical protein
MRPAPTVLQQEAMRLAISVTSESLFSIMTKALIVFKPLILIKISRSIHPSTKGKDIMNKVSSRSLWNCGCSISIRSITHLLPLMLFNI